MATKTKNNPTTITDENSLEIYSWCPKRVLFDALFGLVDGDSDDDRMREIIRLTNDFGAVYGKTVLKAFSFVNPAKEEPVDEEPEVDDEKDDATTERFTDEIPTEVVAKAASVEGPSKPKKAKATARKKKTGSKK